MSRIYIGIDPDVEASGFALFKNQLLVDLKKMDLFELCEALSSYHISHDVLVRLEAGWLIKGNWHRGGSRRSGSSVGRNHEIGRQIEKYCIKHSIPYQLVKPQGYSSYTHERFCKLTGWPLKSKTNSETRVAAMMVYGFI